VYNIYRKREPPEQKKVRKKKMMIKINEKYGAKVGNIQVFTIERAVEVFKMFANRCYNDLTIESSVVLSEVSEDMHKLGFSWSEIEEMEISCIA
jgi:hypothetical protein